MVVAGQMMPGEIEYHKKRFDPAFNHLRNSVELDDSLEYYQPWGWLQPAHHALGALLLEQGHHEEAEAFYQADPGLDSTLSRACQHPGNGEEPRGQRSFTTFNSRDQIKKTALTPTV